MLVDAVLHNTKVYTHGKLVEAEIAINDGKIVKIAKTPNMPSASTKINLKGHITLPGLIDSHVHLRDQQLAYKESFNTGTAAAAAGGVTSVIDMPNNKPITMDACSVAERMKQAKNRILVNVAFNSAFPEQLDEIPQIVKVGAIGFKVYLSNKIGGIDIDDDKQLFSAFVEAGKIGVPVAVHAEDSSIICEKRKEMELKKQNDTAAFLNTHPSLAEVRSIQRVARVMKSSGVHIHFCHISSALAVDAILDAKKTGLPVTCEVTPHNLLLTSEKYVNSGFFALTDPPLRTQNDVKSLHFALKRGYVDIIASDHAPHSIEEKNANSVWEAKPGVPGLETTLSLLLTNVNNGYLSLPDVVRITAEKPAKIFNLAGRGFLEEGNWADIVVVDMKRKHTLDSSFFFSKAKYSPFDGMDVKGKPVMTFVNGKLVMDEGQLINEVPNGSIIRNVFSQNA